MSKKTQDFSRKRSLYSYILNDFRYDKEIFELTLNGILYSVKLIDTAGQEEYDRVRKLFYKVVKSQQSIFL